MRRDSKLSSILHVLLHMAHLGKQGRPMTSEELAGYLDTNAVLVRRVMAGLRERGYVASVKGHGGGWSISCDLAHVTLRDVYEAVGSPTVFAMGNRVEHPECLVEQVVNASLASAFLDAEALLIERLRDVTLADLAQRFSAIYPDSNHRPGAMHVHPK